MTPAASFDGLDGLQARLDAFPAALASALLAKAQALGEALVDKVRNEKLSGQVLNARSGALRDSIAAEVTSAGGTVSATVASVGDVKYAAIQEYGGKTAAHEILPSKAAALAFVEGGATRFARRVEHPGSLIPERSYLRSSVEEMADAIVAALAAAPQEAWEAT
jgi:phage gpG-like protein